MTRENARRRRQVMLAGMAARQTVQGGLTYTDPDLLDWRVRWLLGPGRALMDLDRREAAELAVALIRGHAVIHPEATRAEQMYARTLRLNRTHRELRRAVDSTTAMAAALRSAALAHAAPFAHPVHNPVEDRPRPARCRCTPVPVLGRTVDR